MPKVAVLIFAGVLQPSKQAITGKIIRIELRNFSFSKRTSYSSSTASRKQLQDPGGAETGFLSLPILACLGASYGHKTLGADSYLACCFHAQALLEN